MSNESKEAAVFVDIKELKPWEKNPRINAAAVQKVETSIRRFGFAAPIVARKEDHMIIAGHTRWKAVHNITEYMTGEKKVPVRFMDISKEEAEKLALADNKLNEIAEWDDNLLKDILDDIDTDTALDLGWNTEELVKLLDQFTPDIIGPDKEAAAENENEITIHDEIPEDIKPNTKAGDVIDLGNHLLCCADNLEIMRRLPSNSIDCIVTDPPYGIDFMNKSWDADVPQNEWARECLRVLKSGGHLISFAATRTFHKLVTNLENAGFEVRDTINWLYFSGFPKSLDVSKAIDKHFGAEREIVGSYSGASNIGKKKDGKLGYAPSSNYPKVDLTVSITKPATKEAQEAEGIGTALKPAFEPATLCRKPLSEKSVALNWLKYKTGGINIDQCRFAYGDPCWVGPNDKVGSRSVSDHQDQYVGGVLKNPISTIDPGARWPANIYQCPKASRSERERGLDDMQKTKGAAIQHHGENSKGLNSPRAGAGRTAAEVANIHPTVKPVKLMRWLVRLVTPKNGIVLEPFCGSGTTMIAADLENRFCIGIEREPKYCDIIKERVKHTIQSSSVERYNKEFEDLKNIFIK